MRERLLRLRAALETWVGSLAPRERVMVAAAAVSVAVFTVWLVNLQVGSSLAARTARIEAKTRVLSQIGLLADAYRASQAERAALEARLRARPVPLMSHIAQAGAQLGIEVNDLRPTGAPVEAEGLREESVEVNLARIDLARLGQLLQNLERTQGVVKVRRIRISTRQDDPALVDATVVVATYQLKG